jgi:uncharacterized protein (TIGR02147 family)
MIETSSKSEQITNQDLAAAKAAARSLIKYFMRREIDCRQSHNPSYSLRAFARDTGLSQSTLANVLSDRQNLSLAKSQKIAKNLKLTSKEDQLFVAAADLLSARALIRKKAAYSRLDKMQRESNLVELSHDKFALKSEWYFFAIEELLRMDFCLHTEEWISKKLQISIEKTREALRAMELQQTIVWKKKKWEVLQNFVSVPSAPNSTAVRKFHAGILSKASNSLHNDSPEIRKFGALIFPVRSSDIIHIEAKMRQARLDILAEYEATNGDCVYSLGTFLIPLIQDIKP